MSVAFPQDVACWGQLRIANSLEATAARDPGAVAILAPGRLPLTYARLYHHVHDTCRTLNGWGFGRNDRVALIGPSGPEMAVAFTAIAASATCAPLNPFYRASELDFYLSDLDAQALIIQAGLDSPARTVARHRGIAIMELTPNLQAEAGIFSLTGENRSRPLSTGFAQPDDIALVLHTSGTTARPKKVPLTHANVCISARNIVAALSLTSRDRCLNVMPLYHIHGLVAGILTSLTGGGSVICPPRFDGDTFFAWLDEFHPTWYTAAPTLHQAILSYAKDHKDVVGRCPLRFIRSTSAALPPQVMSELERVFAAPVIEAYSMTEAAHQVCSNPLPPRPRKVGSVGLAMGPAVAIMDEEGNLLGPETIGEVVIRGPSITRGYEGTPTADAASFRDGWFRTGDQGVLDSDGYLFIKGRLKEIINRGGEKISPREVDEILMDHPAVVEAVTFSLPHLMLGEDVAAAVVLRENGNATEAEIRQYAATRLADFKVPCRVLIVDELPKGPTGKLRRLELAEEFGPLLKMQFVPPCTPMEKELARIWAGLLDVDRVGIHDNFFELGGTSLTAVRMFAEIQSLSGRNLPLATLFQAPTIKQMVDVLKQAEESTQWHSLVAIQPRGSRPPFFCMHSVGGNVLYYRALASHLGPDQPFFALQQQGLEGKAPFHRRIEDMASHYLKEIRAFQPEGPYFLGGHSLGGLIAYEAALQLSAQGQRVALLALIDTFFPSRRDVAAEATQDVSGAVSLLKTIRFHLDNLMELEPRGALTYVGGRLKSVGEKLSHTLALALSPLHPRMRQQSPRDSDPFPPEAYYPLFHEIEKNNRQAMSAYVPRSYPGRVTIFLSEAPQALGLLRSRRMPERLAAGGVETHKIPGDHTTILAEPHVRILAERLRDVLGEAIASTRDSGSALALAGANPAHSL